VFSRSLPRSMWSGGWPSRQTPSHPATPVCYGRPHHRKTILFHSCPRNSPSLRNHLFTTSTIDIHGHLVQFPSLEHYRHSLFPFHYSHFNTPIANFSLFRGCRRFFRHDQERINPDRLYFQGNSDRHRTR
jgi:hypothetical protein